MNHRQGPWGIKPTRRMLLAQCKSQGSGRLPQLAAGPPAAMPPRTTFRPRERCMVI